MSKKSENWYLSSSYTETIGFRRPAHKKGFFILRNTLLHILKPPVLTPMCQAQFALSLGNVEDETSSLDNSFSLLSYYGVEQNLHRLKLGIAGLKGWDRLRLDHKGK